jgi:hypothetical protein
MGLSVYPLSLVDNCSVNTLPLQQGIFRSVIFCSVRVVSRERRRLVLPRTLFLVDLFTVCIVMAN